MKFFIDNYFILVFFVCVCVVVVIETTRKILGILKQRAKFEKRISRDATSSRHQSSLSRTHTVTQNVSPSCNTKSCFHIRGCPGSTFDPSARHILLSTFQYCMRLNFTVTIVVKEFLSSFF